MNAIPAELDDLLLGEYEEPQQEEARATMFLKDESWCDWAIRKISKAREDYATAEKLAQAQVERIQAWLDGKRREKEHTEQFFEGKLAEFYLPIYEANKGRKKSFKLPCGAVQFRQQQPEYVRDDERLLAWLHGNGKGDYVVVKESVAWGELKKQLRQHNDRMVDLESGEIVDGILVVDKGLKVKVVTADSSAATEAEGEA